MARQANPLTEVFAPVMRLETEKNNTRHRRNIKRRRAGRGRGKTTALLAVCAALAVFALGAIICVLRDCFHDRYEAERLKEDTVSPAVITTPATADDTDGTTDSTAWDGTGAELTVDFERLLSENPDTVAWLHVPAADVSYPVVYHAENNDYYLHRAFDGTESAAGSIYLEHTNTPDFADRNSFLYGHNMRDGSMFGRLQERFLTEGVYEAEPYFYLYFPDGTVRRYLIFSAYGTENDSDTYLTFTDDDAYDWYAQYTRIQSELTARSVSEAQIVALLAEHRPIVTLSTCAGEAGTTKRFVVHGVFSEGISTNGNPQL